MTTLCQRPPWITGNAGPSIPPIAAAVGYNLRTFGPNVTLGVNLFPFNFFGQTTPPAALVQNGDGSLTCTGNGVGLNLDCCSAKQNNANLNKWQGLAFGGGAYFEAVLKFPAINGGVSGGWPAFWSDPIEGLAGVPSFVQWPGQVAGYAHSCELDFMEFNSGFINKYGFSGHDEYGVAGTITIQTDPMPSPTTVTADLSQYNTYACLWIPATPTTRGSVTWYFNGGQIGTLSYNQYNPALAPPPIAGTSAMSILDVRHPCLIFGVRNPALPMTIQSCSVWQASAAGNLFQGPAPPPAPVHKFNPGFYMLSNNVNGSPSPAGNGSNASELALLTNYHTNVRGWVGNYSWRALESTQGNYSGINSFIGADYLALQAAMPGAKMGIAIRAWAQFLGTGLTAAQVTAPHTFVTLCPDYIFNCGGTLNGTSVAIGPNGSQYGFAMGDYGNAGAGLYDEIFIAFWNTAINARIIALYQAIAATVVPDGLGFTYDTHPNIEFVMSLDEWSIPLSAGGFNPPAGCNYASCQSAYLAWAAAAAAAFPHTMVPGCYTFGVAGGGAAETYQQLLNDLGTLSAINGFAFSGADCQGGAFTSSHNESYAMWEFIGNSYTNMNLAAGSSTPISGGGSSLINKMANIAQMQAPDYDSGKKSGVVSDSQQAVTDCITASQVMGATHALLCCASENVAPNPAWGGSGTTHPGFIYNAIQASAAINTTRPSLLT